MHTKNVQALVAGMLVFAGLHVGAFAQGSSMLQSQVSQSQARVDRLYDDAYEIEARIQGNVDQLINLLTGVSDSPESGTKIVRAKESALMALKKRVDVYNRERDKMIGAPNSPWRRTPTSAQQERLAELDQRREERIDQIVGLSASLATHQDVEKYTIERRTQMRNYKKTVSDEYTSNRRVTTVSEPLRETVIEKGEASIADIERQAAELERQLRTARSPEQREDLEARLAAVNERLSTRKNQVDTVDSQYPTPTQQVGNDEANEILEFIDDEVRQIQEDFRRLQVLQSDVKHEQNRLRSLQQRAGMTG